MIKAQVCSLVSEGNHLTRASDRMGVPFELGKVKDLLKP